MGTNLAVTPYRQNGSGSAGSSDILATLGQFGGNQGVMSGPGNASDSGEQHLQMQKAYVQHSMGATQRTMKVCEQNLEKMSDIYDKTREDLDAQRRAEEEKLQEFVRNCQIDAQRSAD